MAPSGQRTPDPVDIAWRVHDALRDWTGKVDGKASFALTIESAALGAVIALSGKDGALSGLGGCALAAYRVGLAALVVATLAAVSAVVPQVRGRPTKRDWRTNFIFFGHLRHWAAEDLMGAWESRDVLPVLAAQAIAMSKIAWWKHRALQVSLIAASFGTAALATASIFKE